MRLSASRNPVALFAIAAMLLVFSLISGVRSARIAFGAQHAPGEVVELGHRTSGGRHRRKVDYPIVRFRDAAGVERTIEGKVADNFGMWRVGERVDVLFPPGQPERAQVGGFYSLWSTALGFGLGAIAAAFAGLRRMP